MQFFDETPFQKNRYATRTCGKLKNSLKNNNLGENSAKFENEGV